MEGWKEVVLLGSLENIWQRLGVELINLSCNPIGKVPNAPLSSAPGKEYHPLILGKIGAHGGQVKREISGLEVTNQEISCGDYNCI